MGLVRVVISLTAKLVIATLAVLGAAALLRSDPRTEIRPVELGHLRVEPGEGTAGTVLDVRTNN